MRVLKPITTPSHHFAAGVEIAPEDLDGPLSVADWQLLGHLEAPAAEAPASSPKPGKVAPVVAPTDSALSD